MREESNGRLSHFLVLLSCLGKDQDSALHSEIIMQRADVVVRASILKGRTEGRPDPSSDEARVNGCPGAGLRCFGDGGVAPVGVDGLECPERIIRRWLLPERHRVWRFGIQVGPGDRLSLVYYPSVWLKPQDGDATQISEELTDAGGDFVWCGSSRETAPGDGRRVGQCQRSSQR